MVNLGKHRKFAMLGLGPTGMSKFRPVVNAGERFEDSDTYYKLEPRRRKAPGFVRDPFSIGDFPALQVPRNPDDTGPMSPTTSHGSYFY